MRVVWALAFGLIIVVGNGGPAHAHPSYERPLASVAPRDGGARVFYVACHVDGVSTFDRVYPVARTTPTAEGACDLVEVESGRGYYDVVADCAGGRCEIFGFDSVLHPTAARVTFDGTRPGPVVAVAWPRGLVIHLKTRGRAYAITSLAGALLAWLLLVTTGRGRLRVAAVGVVIPGVALLAVAGLAARLIVVPASLAVGAGVLVALGAWRLRERWPRARPATLGPTRGGEGYGRRVGWRRRWRARGINDL